MVFVLGFLSGFLANWVFGMLTRLLPEEWVRYQVRISGLDADMTSWPDFDWRTAVLVVSPRWTRALMPPLREYLSAHARIDDRPWRPVKWEEGDVGSFRLRADAATAATILLAQSFDRMLYLGDYYGSDTAQSCTVEDSKPHTVELQVIRVVDGEVAATAEYAVTTRGKQSDLIGLSVPSHA